MASMRPTYLSACKLPFLVQAERSRNVLVFYHGAAGCSTRAGVISGMRPKCFSGGRVAAVVVVVVVVVRKCWGCRRLVYR
jgi:hypothetical protein